MIVVNERLNTVVVLVSIVTSPENNLNVPDVTLPIISVLNVAAELNVAPELNARDVQFIAISELFVIDPPFVHVMLPVITVGDELYV